MIRENTLKVGDTILYKRRKKVMEWEVLRIAPSGKYAEIENDNWSERWIYYGEILEIVESEEPEVLVAVERPPVIESKFKV